MDITEDRIWRELVQSFAIRAREFSDAVATLGRAAHVGSEGSGALLDEIYAKQKLCVALAEQVERYINTKAAAARTK